MISFVRLMLPLTRFMSAINLWNFFGTESIPLPLAEPDDDWGAGLGLASSGGGKATPERLRAP